MFPKISVIIPVYNAEKYIEDCINSIINQSLSEIEIICVINGSTDNSLSILENYAEKDKRIIIIIREKADLGAARNAGIRAAAGEYLMFVDSDDWIRLDSCEKLYDTAKKNDLEILQGLHYQVPERFVVFFKYKKKLFNKISTGMEFWQNNLNISSANWDKIWKRSFFIENNLYNPEGVYYEDGMTSIRGMFAASRFMAVDYKFYYYRWVETSITHTALTSKHIFSYQKFTENLNVFIINNELDNNPLLITYYFKSLFIYYALFQREKVKEMREKLGEIDKKLITNFPLRIKASSYLPLTAFRAYHVWRKREIFRCFIARIFN